MYTVYHIKNHARDGKPYVGCTYDSVMRTDRHGVTLEEMEILHQVDDIEEAKKL